MPVPYFEWIDGTVALSITNRCNQRCIFCYERNQRSTAEPTLDEVKKWIETASTRYRMAVFMGGEALLRKDILQIIRYTRSLGLQLSISTNGQALARDGFVDQLTEAGLEMLTVSFHYGDAETFARGSGTPPRFFERLLRGLACLRDEGLRSPDRAIDVIIETDLFTYNLGHLKQIRALLEETLGKRYRVQTLGRILPPAKPDTEQVLLDPLEERREEIVDFLATSPPDRPVVLAKMPLCLAPGWEHLSLDVALKLEDPEIVCNFDQRDAVERMHDYEKSFLDNPYRWVCCDCNLLPICPTTGSKWYSRTHPPSRGQKPVPVTDRSVDDVFARLGKPRTIRRVELDARASDLRPVIPERELLRGIETTRGRNCRLLDSFCGEEPIIDLDLVVDSEQVRLRLRPINNRRDPAMGFLIRYLDVVIVDSGLPIAIQLKALKHLASCPFPALELWEEYPHMDTALSALAEAIWNRFGDRIWPGSEFGQGWSTADLQRHSESTFLLGLESPRGGRRQIRFDAADFPQT